MYRRGSELLQIPVETEVFIRKKFNMSIPVEPEE